MHKKTAHVFAATVIVTAGVGFGLAAPASANGGNAHHSGDCSATSTWELTANATPGGKGHTIEVKFRLRTDTGGEAWDWSLTDNGNVAASGENSTANNGKLDVDQQIPNLKGFDKIVLSATDTVTGETCTGHVIVTSSH